METSTSPLKPRYVIKGFSGDLSNIDPSLGPTSLEQITKQDFKNGRNRRYGTSNPEKFDIPFWNAMIKGGYSPYTARRVFIDGVTGADMAREGTFDMKKLMEELAAETDDDTLDIEKVEGEADAETTPLEFRHVEYGMNVESEGYSFGDASAVFWSNPIWCNNRAFEAVVDLPDGRMVEIGGERDDAIDPNFMVYNDVIVS
jgi:hypothetical protein